MSESEKFASMVEQEMKAIESGFQSRRNSWLSQATALGCLYRIALTKLRTQGAHKHARLAEVMSRTVAERLTTSPQPQSPRPRASTTSDRKRRPRSFGRRRQR